MTAAEDCAECIRLLGEIIGVLKEIRVTLADMRAEARRSHRRSDTVPA